MVFVAKYPKNSGEFFTNSISQNTSATPLKIGVFVPIQ